MTYCVQWLDKLARDKINENFCHGKIASSIQAVTLLEHLAGFGRYFSLTTEICRKMINVNNLTR